MNDMVLFVEPVADVQSALASYQRMKDFVAGVLKEHTDFGVIPGTPKPTLLKPGAEKLSRFFGLSLPLTSLEVTEDWTGADHNGEPFFFYRYKASAMRGGQLIAEGIGSCSSWERKYRYRNSERVCPACGKGTIIKGKQEYGGGWLCFQKKGGCGAKFPVGDPAIEGQEIGQINNPDPADIVNTIDKMAQKRAIIAAVLLACNASEYFTQDIEDYVTPGEWVEVENAPISHSIAPVKQTVKPASVKHNSSSMTIEEAEALWSETSGCTIGCLTNEELVYRLNSLLAVKKATSYQVEKITAIRLILEAREKGRPVQVAPEPETVGTPDQQTLV
jgi:hypothetical protein